MSRRIQTLARNHPLAAGAAFLVLGLAFGLAGCDADSPSEPQQQPGTPPGTGPISGTFNITISLSPPEIPAGSADPVQVTVRVVRTDNGQPPPTGTTIVLAAGGGAFGAPDGPSSVVVQTVNGQVTVPFFPPLTVGSGTVLIQARLESSIGQATLRIAEPATFFIASVSPTTGSPNGGEQVTIQGGGFAEPVRVTFGGIPAQVLSVTPSRIRVVTPPAPSAVPVGGTLPVAVSVTINLNELDQAIDTLPSAFIYARGGSVEQPLVFSVTPASGPNEGGTRITINGEGFQAPVQVFFGDGASASDFTGIEASVQSVTSNRIVVLAPSATGFGQDNRNSTVNILVKNLQNGFSTVATSAYRYGVGIVISAIQPNEVPEVPTNDDLVIIFGQGFEQPLVVEVGPGQVQPQVISVTGTEIVFRPEPFRGGVPCGQRVNAGQVTVRLINSGEFASSLSSLFFTGPLQFVITAVTPTSGDEDGGFPVTISGQNFTDPVRVSFEGPEGSATVTGDANPAGAAVTVTAPNFTGKLEEEDCNDNGDAQEGRRFLPTTVDIVLSNPVTGCSDTFPDAFTFLPDDSSCRGDIAPVPPPETECTDGFDNDDDTFIDEADPGCTGPGDDDETDPP
jgi:hypothetical protein